MNGLENELADKEQEQNEVIQQYRPPSLRIFNRFNNLMLLHLLAIVHVQVLYHQQINNKIAGIEGIESIDLKFTLIRQNTYGGYDSGDFSDAFDDIVDDDVESEKLEKRRQSKLIHSRNNSAYSGLNFYDAGSNNRLGDGQMNVNFEKMFQEMNEKMVKD